MLETTCRWKNRKPNYRKSYFVLSVTLSECLKMAPGVKTFQQVSRDGSCCKIHPNLPVTRCAVREKSRNSDSCVCFFDPYRPVPLTHKNIKRYNSDFTFLSSEEGHAFFFTQHPPPCTCLPPHHPSSEIHVWIWWICRVLIELSVRCCTCLTELPQMQTERWGNIWLSWFTP